ncbi:MAG: DUF459 domain-containing protein [Spirochaetales bacterium]|nr:DUF459 domain-containing protein [Spirochaetales bacterium]
MKLPAALFFLMMILNGSVLPGNAAAPGSPFVRQKMLTVPADSSQQDYILRRNRITSLIRHGEFEEAVSQCDAALQTAQKNSKHVFTALKAEAFYYKKDINGARILMRSVLKMNPGYIDVNRKPKNGSIHTAEFLDRFFYSPKYPLKVLLIGDSLVAGSLRRKIFATKKSHQGVSWTVNAKTSSGLTRPDFHDWPAIAEKVLSGKKFKALFILLGTNDAQDFRSGKKRIYFYGKPDWFEKYEERVKTFLDTVSPYVMNVYWIGLPPMKYAHFNTKMAKFNVMYETACGRKANAVFIGTKDIYSDKNGKYAQFLPRNGKQLRTRENDGIHVTDAGMGFLVDRIYENLNRDFFLRDE